MDPAQTIQTAGQTSVAMTCVIKIINVVEVFPDAKYFDQVCIRMAVDLHPKLSSFNIEALNPINSKIQIFLQIKAFPDSKRLPFSFPKEERSQRKKDSKEKGLNASSP